MKFKNDKELNKAVMDFLKENSGLVHIIISSITKDAELYKELSQDAFIILRKWYPKFNPEYNYKLTTYLGTCLWEELKRRLKSHRLIRLPEYVYANRSKYIKDATGEYKDYEKYFNLVERTHLINNFVYYEDDNNKIRKEYLTSENEGEKLYEKNRLHGFIETYINRLPEKEKYIIKEYFLNEDNDKTLAEIGEELGISCSRAAKLKDRGLRTLKSRLEHYYDKNIGDLFDD